MQGRSCEADDAEDGHELDCLPSVIGARRCGTGDDALIDALAQDGIAYVPFFPLGGFNPLQSATLSDVAERVAATPMQVALAWLLRRSPNILLTYRQA
ncbi:putative oxidoreductase YdbC [Sphingomonas mucosissima]|uniref:Putative oxidoreductase YdbC n=1 Tax=Sphingomonas mucosissima TaxID=370959 RepID=A0A245ZE07_9SPHN|nr:putative oxidoreductase YdbC [Sphingomonas mucosissima]